jgi:hypothetical protein
MADAARFHDTLKKMLAVPGDVEERIIFLW